MSALLTTPSPTDRAGGGHADAPATGRHAHHAGDPPRWAPESGPTLDDVVSRNWEVLRAGAPAACMVCGGELAPRRTAQGVVAGGRCDSCGSALG
jgi:hypothetical protein